MIIFRALFLLCLLLFPITLRASFIEATMGAAVVDDATAVFYNPAALALLKNRQIIILNTVSSFSSEFTGRAIQVNTGFTQSGNSDTTTRYYLPSLYLGMPVTNHVTVGFAVISNFFNNDPDGSSILRYVQSSNKIQNVDFVPALEYKFNDFFSVGASINLSYADFLLMRTLGFPSLNIPDSQSRNESDATGIGGDVGFLLKPSQYTTIGFNYRSAVTYQFNGTSILESNPEVISNDYGFKFWTPARSVLSINQMITPAFGMIGTVQYIQWSIFKEIDIHGIATKIGSQPVILDAKVPYYLRDTWLLTLGAYQRITPKLILRVAGSYNQSPANGNYQISNGDSIIVGPSISYQISKNMIIDASYAHAFIQNKDIHITGAINQIDGVTSGFLDTFSLKLTFNI